MSRKISLLMDKMDCLYLADPATFLAPYSVLGPYRPLRTACLFSFGKK